MSQMLPEELFNSAKGLEITLVALGKFGGVLEAGPPVDVASPQQNDPCTQGSVRAGVEGGLEWCGGAKSCPDVH